MAGVVCLTSGGQDSTTCLFWAKQHFGPILALAFDYGQRHRIELEAAQVVCDAGPFWKQSAGDAVYIFGADQMRATSANIVCFKG